MRFFHLSDLHFGKIVHGVNMAEKDQPYWVEQFLQKVEEYHPHAVLIAGDVYDRKVPSVEAIRLFNHMVTVLTERGVAVLIIAGNHDSGVRLSCFGELLSRSGVYIAGNIRGNMMKVPLKDDHGTVNFWLMPYLFPKLAAEVLDQPELGGYDEAVRALLAAQSMEEGERNVLLVHQNVQSQGNAPDHSRSESIVGGLGEVEAGAFDAFDYVALGHIHNAQHIGREAVRYAGCPLYYDFSECDRDKRLTLVDLGPVGTAPVITRVEIPLLHGMRRITGTLEEVLAQKKDLEDPDHLYVEAVLTDPHLPAHTMDQLRAVYGDNLMHVVRDVQTGEDQSEGAAASGDLSSRRELSMNELFGAFYLKQNQEMMDSFQDEVLRRLMEQQSRCGGDHVVTADRVKKEDTEELIAFLMREEAEG